MNDFISKEKVLDQLAQSINILEAEHRIKAIRTVKVVPVKVLNKIRAEIEAEMNNLYRQKSIDQRTLTIIHACQRHIAIIDEYRKEQE